jgi:hypothetical protein
MDTVSARVCVSCRTILRDGGDCEGKHHKTIALGEKVGRRQLDDEVWGPDSRARTMRKMAKAGASGGGLGGILQGCGGGCDGLSGCGDLAGAGEGALAVLAVLAAILVFALVGIIVWFIAKKIIEYWRDRPKPQGALLAPPGARGKRVQCAGIVKSGKLVDLPWREGQALAYAFEIHQKRVFGGGAMAREARTGGLEVALDDGRTLRIPEGRVHITTKKKDDDVDKKQLDDFLGDLDPWRLAEEPSLFPYDFARAITIAPGDRIEMLGEVTTAADESGAQGYRANAAILVPASVPTLRVRQPGAEPRVRVDVPTATDEEPESAKPEEQKLNS